MILRRLGVTASAILLSTMTIAAPARADFTPAYAGYVWAHSPTSASYTVPLGGYAQNSGGGSITITRSAAGSYQVRFGGLGAQLAGGGGVVHAEAYGYTANFCTVGSWYPSGSDLLVNVYCFGTTGARLDTRFVASFVEASRVSATEGVSYLWANNPTTSSYVPAAWYRFDVTGGTPSIIRDGVGTYRVHLPAASGQAELSFYQTTAYTSSAVACKVAGYLGGGWARVHCRTHTGTLADSRFTITWTIYNLLQRIAPTAMAAVHNTYPLDTTPAITWTNDSSVSDDYVVTRLGAGYYQMYFPQIQSPGGHAVVHASGYQQARCAIVNWLASGTADMTVRVYCVDSAGGPVDTPFLVAFTW